MRRGVSTHAALMAPSLISPVGGADPDLNPRLAAAITNAKKGALTKAAIASSIARGQGRAADGAVLEHVNVEAMLPYGVAVIIECLTESKNRVLNDLRGTIKSSGGSITPTAFLFDRRGKIWFMEQDRLLVDDIFDDAIEAGATDIDDDQGKLVVVTEPHEVNRVAHVLGSKYALDVERSEIVHIPKEDSKVSLSDDQWAEIDVVLERLEQEPSLQNVFVNVAGRGLK